MVEKYYYWTGLNERISQFILPYYDQRHRHYHNLDHITEMLWGAVNYFPDATAEQYTAIYFHDIIYDPKSGFNEADSVTVMRKFFREDKKRCGTTFSNESLDLIENIIMDTKGHFYPTCEESRLVLDLDLERLSRPLNKVQEFSEQIFNEFQFVSRDVYTQNRRDFFMKMLMVDPIFSTDFGRKNWEPIVRTNLQISIKMMEK
jgi:predicted metal-dependent HD superfamily phosphohydrolase